MRCLVVEDDFGSRRLLQILLRPVGDVDIAIDGHEAVDAFRLAWMDGEPYHIIFMDIMMPNMDGQEALRKIRDFEKEHKVRPAAEVPVIMTTAMDDPRNVVEAYYKGGATGYLVKPIRKDSLYQELKRVGIDVAL